MFNSTAVDLKLCCDDTPNKDETGRCPRPGQDAHTPRSSYLPRPRCVPRCEESTPMRTVLVAYRAVTLHKLLRNCG
jgi:hypothetical protein